MLAGSPYQLSAALSADAGLAELRATAHAVVVLDILMPDKEGLETIGELTSEFPAIPIVAISGGGRLQGEYYVEVARRMGAHATLVKPFTKEQLLAVLDEVTGAS